MINKNDIDQYGQNERMGQPSKTHCLTPEMCRAARGLLGWTQGELAERAEVSRGTVRDYESARHGNHRATEVQLRRALEAGGARFLDIENVGMTLCSARRPEEPKH